MDDRPPKRSLADDPNFLASLSELDRGLADGPPDDTDLDDELMSLEWPAPASVPPPRQFPAIVAPAAPPPRRLVPSPDIVHQDLPLRTQPPPVLDRPLTDLFPPPPVPSLPSDDDIGDAFAERRPAGPQTSRGFAPPSGNTLTYETFYGLSEKPFSLASDPKFLYHSASHDQAVQSLLSAIRRREGIVVLTGPIGSGKTILCRAVIEQLDRRTLTSFVTDPFVTFEDLLKTVLVDFGVISRADLAAGRLAQTSRHDLMSALQDFLVSLAPLQAFAVVIIDEAQHVPTEVLEQLRMLSDIESQQRMLQVVLVGQPELLAMLRLREIEPIDQRVAVRCTLDHLTPDEIGSYVSHRLMTAGTNPRVEFDEAALAQIFTLSRGIPRVVNLLCDRALTIGYGTAASVIDVSIVNAAADELDLGVAEGRRSRFVRVALTAGVLLALTLAGASVAALVFHDQLGRIAWKTAPTPPAPSPQVPGPLTPVAAPDASPPLPAPER